MLQCVRISVGRTWRFVTNTSASVSYSKTGYRGRIDSLKGSAADDDFQLPWPPYRSRLWERMFNGTYHDRRSPVLVATLLPLLHRAAPVDIHRCRTGGEPEALQHPFALSTLVHLELAPVVPWPPDPAAAAVLRAVLESPLAADAQVRDGLPLEALPPLPTVDADDVAAHFEEAGHFVVVSALHEGAPEPKALAGRLSCLFEDTVNAAGPLKSDGGALCVSGNVVGLVLPHTLPRAGDRMRCLHHNYATLLAYLENLATLTPAPTTKACQWFQGRAAELLNHLYRRAPLPDTGGIYRSRLPEAWIDQRRIAPFVNALTTPGLPKLPTPA